MTRRLVFVHGRAQQHKDAVALKQSWVDAWAQGLEHSGLEVPLADADIRFPYYGDTLEQLVAGNARDDVAQVIVRGTPDEDEQEFVRAVLAEVQAAAGVSDAEVQAAAGVSDAEVQAAAGPEAIERGPQNWAWVQAVLSAIDTHVPGASAASVALATKDVYAYLKNPGIRDPIETGVRAAVDPGAETVVVAHSLGTVVAFDLLRREGDQAGWKVPLFVTLGSPLAVTVIRKSLAPISRPRCVGAWFNAMDDADIVSLYPLAAPRFDVRPPVENKTDVHNPTPNRHGISGYLADPVVARRIYDAVTA